MNLGKIATKGFCTVQTPDGELFQFSSAYIFEVCGCILGIIPGPNKSGTLLLPCQTTRPCAAQEAIASILKEEPTKPQGIVLTMDEATLIVQSVQEE